MGLDAADHADLPHAALDLLGRPVGNEAVLAVEGLCARVRVGHPQRHRLLRIDDRRQQCRPSTRAVVGRNHVEDIQLPRPRDAVIWVQADEREAGRRRLARDRDPDALDLANQAVGGSPSDHAGWMAEEIPFNAAQRTWERADVIVCGTPQIPCDPGTEVVVAPPPRPAADDPRR